MCDRLVTPTWLTTVPPEVRAASERHLTALVGTHGADLSVKTLIVEGEASQQILDQAARDRADLIVVGGRRPTETTPAFRGTGVRLMRRATCPVLALPGQPVSQDDGLGVKRIDEFSVVYEPEKDQRRSAR